MRRSREHTWWRGLAFMGAPWDNLPALALLAAERMDRGTAPE
jgi:hypothetical protein